MAREGVLNVNMQNWVKKCLFTVHMPFIQVWEQRQAELCEFGANQLYIVSFKIAKTTQ